MSFQEWVRRWRLDADIIVDFQVRQVKFKNEKRFFDGRELATKIGLSLAVFLPLILSGGEPASCLGVLAVFLFFFFLYPYLYPLIIGVGPLRTLYFRIGKKRPSRQITLRNPEGTVEFETDSAMPFFDLEFPKRLGKQLQRVSLLKKDRRTKILKLEILGKASGDLVIKEF